MRTSVKPVDVARVLYALIRGVRPDDAERNLAAAYFAETGAPVDYRSFQRFTDALILSLPQQHALLALVPQWHSVFSHGEVKPREAAEFIRQYLAAMDHSLFVKLPLFVGKFTGANRHPIHFGGFGDTHVDSWMLVFTLAGSGHCRAGLRRFELTADTILLIEPGTLIDFSGSEKTRWNFYWVIFQSADRWRTYLQLPQAGPGVRQLAVPEDAAAAIRITLNQLYQNYIDVGALKTELDHNLLEQLLLRCGNLLPRESNRELDPRVQAARAYIDEHYASDIGLEEIAAASNLSPSRLSSLFRSETGSSVMAYRNELRLVQAAQLLLHSNLRIAEIGSRVGYAEQAFFSRIFRKHLGMSPRQYRANVTSAV
jgi:AraC family transcriptional regulator of arabinose operon